MRRNVRERFFKKKIYFFVPLLVSESSPGKDWLELQRKKKRKRGKEKEDREGER